MKLLMVFLCLSFSLDLFADSLTFKKDGKLVKSISSAQIQKGKIEEIKSTEVTLYNAWRAHSYTYIGYDLFKILDATYGPKWRSSSVIKFVSLDGYSSLSNIQAMFKASAGKTGFLTYKEKDKKGFTLVKRGLKEVDPGPIYLVWSNFSDGDKATYGDALKWPYQLKEIDILN